MNLTRAAKGKGWLAVVCSLLMVYAPVGAAPAPAPIGTVSSAGSIELNGVAAAPGTNVYPGNWMATASGKMGYVGLSSGGRLLLGGSTSAQIYPQTSGLRVLLDHGAVRAMSEAKAPVVVSAGGVLVRAEKLTGVYEVALHGNVLEVLASRGSAIVEAADRTLVVAPGKRMRAELAPTSGNSKKKNKKSSTFKKVGIGLAVGTTILVGTVEATKGGKKNCLSPSQLGC